MQTNAGPILPTLLASFALLVSWLPARADTPAQGPVITVTEENDLFSSTDRHYTQGLKFTQMFSDDKMPAWLLDYSAEIPAFGMDIEHRKLGFTFGQNIYTPGNIDIPTLIPDDRPYAGWLYLGWIFQRRGTTQSKRPVLENYELNLGIIGPEALGEEAQTTVHKFWHIRTPKGWSNQLKIEPGLALRYTRMWLYRIEGAGIPADLIPQLGGSLGNVGTYLESGFTLRTGFHVPMDFGNQTVDAPTVTEGVAIPKWGFSVYSGLYGRAVAYNAFLDGNLFQHSHHVQKNYFVGEFRLGASLILKRMELSYLYALRTREFRHQIHNDAFGSVSLTYRF